MIEKIRALSFEVAEMRERSRQLNIKLSELNGVAAVIPRTKKYPLNAFRGSKIILHNVQYDIHTGEIYAAIKLPYTGRSKCTGSILVANINENWFPE